MSWWISLTNENEELLEVPKHTDGGTYIPEGTSEAELNITYNYSKHYYNELDSNLGLKWLNERKAKDCIERLKKAVQALGTERYLGSYYVKKPFSDVVADTGGYWKPTKGNAGYALLILLKWAEEYPEGEFRVS